ncbi:hypothetical protein HSBAA_59940 [Vreelandella sulfidaeris]|uniref:FAD dependent oxidoreductase domain-containing protein n=1 Tax=Vreelandella sulfidaeris TaxID=115553 RepID=A0A455UK00_9GAMM|nr:hypothetical protein HSBAA_59940 [Halomonas sulfidaeris]
MVTACRDIGADQQHAWVTANVDTNSEPVRETFDSVVVCAGVGSRALATKLGDRVNIYPVKGYSITVQLDDAASQQAAPTVSLLDDETKLVTSRLGNDRFRIAGTAEFNGFNRDIRDNRIRPLIRWVEECFPGVSTRRVVPWAGLRPMLPNMLPKVGRGRITHGVLQHRPRPSGLDTLCDYRRTAGGCSASGGRSIGTSDHLVRLTPQALPIPGSALRDRFWG